MRGTAARGAPSATDAAREALGELVAFGGTPAGTSRSRSNSRTRTRPSSTQYRRLSASIGVTRLGAEVRPGEVESLGGRAARLVPAGTELSGSPRTDGRASERDALRRDARRAQDESRRAGEPSGMRSSDGAREERAAARTREERSGGRRRAERGTRYGGTGAAQAAPSTMPVVSMRLRTARRTCWETAAGVTSNSSARSVWEQPRGTAK